MQSPGPGSSRPATWISACPALRERQRQGRWGGVGEEALEPGAEAGSGERGRGRGRREDGGGGSGWPAAGRAEGPITHVPGTRRDSSNPGEPLPVRRDCWVPGGASLLRLGERRA